MIIIKISVPKTSYTKIPLLKTARGKCSSVGKHYHSNSFEKLRLLIKGVCRHLFKYFQKNIITNYSNKTSPKDLLLHPL